MIIIQNPLLFYKFPHYIREQKVVYLADFFSGIFGESKKITADVLQMTGPKSIHSDRN